MKLGYITVPYISWKIIIPLHLFKMVAEELSVALMTRKFVITNQSLYSA